MMHYRCSECHKPIGAMLDNHGQPQLFKCHNSGRVANMVPDRPIQRSTPHRPRNHEAALT